jgi:CheY-like chemotaxis protein
VVLVGEIRDRETAQIAVQASLTGHLVLSTLHTNDAANAVTRLVDIGVESFKIAAAVRGVVAQRLMRRLCTACKEVWVESIPPKMHRWIPADTPLYRAVGCQECAMTGFRGRFSIVEVLRVTPDVEHRIGQNETADKIAEAARAGGMKTLWESGLVHVVKGDSTIDELLRVVDMPQDDEVLAERRRASGAKARADAAPPAEAPQPAPRQTPSGSEAPRTSRSAALSGSFDIVAEGEQPRAPDRSSGGARAPMQGKRVLLVDDEDQLRRVMRDLLEREGYVVVEAGDGVEALDQVDRHAPDIIVLDLNLPGLDGFGVLSHLRSRRVTQEIPVIVLTARGDEENEIRVFEFGADDFLSKPFRARALSARLEAVLRRTTRAS